MRIRARWTWVPLAITVAGAVYLSLVEIPQYLARLNEPTVVRAPSKPFVPPPAHVPAAGLPEPPPALSPVQPASPPIPGTKLPPFHPKK